MRMRKYLGVMAALGLLASSIQLPAKAGEPFGGKRHNMPPASRLAEPGPMVGGPGPGVLMPETIPAGNGYGVATMPAIQVLFSQPQSMQILYDVVGDNTFTSDPLVVPGRLEFAPGGIYRLKLTNIEGREGVELYPTLEVAGGSPRTAAYLAHNAVPVQFDETDFNQALAGNFVTKVIYLPDPEFQGDALGIDTLVSTRLEPGLDPIIEADRRGAILGIIRLGNKDVEMSGPAVGGGGAGMMMIGADGAPCGPDGSPMSPYGNPPNMVAGVTAPQYGMTYSGTPIGLPGPPHIPLGAPAGLQKHTIRNHTHMNIPDPVSNMKMHVRSIPGQSYPQPPSRVNIREQNIHPGYPTGRPPVYHGNQSVPGGQFGGNMAEADCPPGVIR